MLKVFGATLAAGLMAGTALAAPPPTASARVEAILSKMTLEEKIGLVSTSMPSFSAETRAQGAPISAAYNPGVPRLGVPALKESDASLGVANGREMRKGDTETALPAGLATAASFDPAIAEAGGAMIGAEARAKTFNVLLAGGVNLTRDPWGGRDFEYLGEDPLLAGTLAGAAVRGIQSNHIVSTMKHFALNPQETGRMVGDARIGAEALRESDLLAFELTLEGGRPGSVMCSYNKLNGDYACENDPLLNGVLKKDWGYRGWVMSDWGADHSAEKAALAGLDQESGREIDQLLNHSMFFHDKLQAAVQAGRVRASRLDDMVRRILTGLADTGALDHPTPATPQPLDVERDAAVAQRAEEAGAVLLRNEGGALPLAAGVKHVAVIGGHADVAVLSGGGSSQVRSVGGAPIERPVRAGDASSFSSQTWHASSPLKALRAALPGAEVSYVGADAMGGEDVAAAVRAARSADAVVLFATAWRTEGEDAPNLSLDDAQDRLVDAVTAANPHTVVVLETGGPVLMPWLDRTAAVLEAWYPGQRGGEAIARILTGQVNPSGRLPMTFPAAASQAPRPEPAGADLQRARAARQAKGQSPGLMPPFPIDYVEGANVGYRWYELKAETPLFPFGYGLSYTRFRYSGLKVRGGAHPSATLEVANTGGRAGADVPQVYVRAADGEGRETWRLAGFSRVALQPGARRVVTIPLEPRTFSRWDEAGRRWVRPSGVQPLAVGRSATDRVLTATLPAG